jgi:hypothetical protein
MKLAAPYRTTFPLNKNPKTRFLRR